MDQKEVNLRLAISQVPQVGPSTFVKILENFGSISAFAETSNLNPKLIKIQNLLKEFNVNKFLEEIDDEKIQVTVYGDEFYPKLLAGIPDFPIVLFVKGDKSKLAALENSVSIVGTRSPTEYGKNITAKLVEDLVKAGIVINSGLAFGIDKIVHLSTLKYKGITCGVAPGAITKIFPVSHTYLYEKIIDEGGIIISEFFKIKDTYDGMFPQRNRILAGMARATVVIEAAAKSGSLISANMAFGYGREVFAIPGNLGNKYSQGTNSLIKQNKASLLEDAADILEILGFIKSEKSQISIFLEPDEIKVYDFVASVGEIYLDELNLKLDWPTSKLLSILMALELKGKILQDSVGRFRPIF